MIPEPAILPQSKGHMAVSINPGPFLWVPLIFGSSDMAIELEVPG